MSNKHGIILDEKILEDNYPVFWDYLYVVNDKVIKSDIQGTIKDLKMDLRDFYNMEVTEIKNCDIYNRRKILELDDLNNE